MMTAMQKKSLQKAMNIQNPQGGNIEDDESKYESLITQMAKKRVSKLIEITEKEYDPNANWGEEEQNEVR